MTNDLCWKEENPDGWVKDRIREPHRTFGPKPLFIHLHLHLSPSLQPLTPIALPPPCPPSLDSCGEDGVGGGDWSLERLDLDGWGGRGGRGGKGGLPGLGAPTAEFFFPRKLCIFNPILCMCRMHVQELTNWSYNHELNVFFFSNINGKSTE